MSPTEGLSCQELVELVTDYVEGALTTGDRARFEEHLADCVNCAIYFEQMRVTVLLLGRLPFETIPPEAERTLLHAFRSWNEGRADA